MLLATMQANFCPQVDNEMYAQRWVFSNYNNPLNSFILKASDI